MMKHSFFLLSVCAVFCVGAFNLSATAQVTATPTSEQMIEQLKTSKTRSLRNLTIEPLAQAATANTSTTPVTSIASTSQVVAASQAPSASTEPRPSLSLLIQFDFDSARVRPVSQQDLVNLAAALQSKELQDSKFAIEGHTDSKGRFEYNLRLSQQRADAVRDVLVSQGVKLERLKAQGKGSSELSLRAQPEAAENRRVRIVNLD